MMVNVNRLKLITRKKNPDIRKLDTVFSIYIRMSRSIDGMCTCCTCGKMGHWKQFDNGHFISRAKYPTRWDERNCHPQCRQCNRFDEGRKNDYERFIAKRYSTSMPNILKLESRNTRRTVPVQLELLVKYYREKVKELKKRIA